MLYLSQFCCRNLITLNNSIPSLKIMMGHQDEDKLDVSDDDSVKDRMICERNDVRVGVNTMIII